MKDRLHILRALARQYERTQAGRTGEGQRDLLLDYEEFLRGAGCADGDARRIAESVLADVASDGVLTLEAHRRDSKLIQQIRFNREQEKNLFARFGEPSPTECRHILAQQFRDAARLPVPEQWRVEWEKLSTRYEGAAQHGDSVAPFERDKPDLNAELLTLVPQLLEWKGESLLRFASCVLCDDSKRLESLSGRLEQLLGQLTGQKIKSLENVGILANPRFVLLHGPMELQMNGQVLDFGILAGPFRLSGTDIIQAQAIRTSAIRCLTVENETTFHELAKLRSGELLIQTSFPGSGTLALLRRLPDAMEFWHFGDTDAEGFEILRDLRERARRPFRALHMRYRPSSESCPLSTEERRKVERLLNSPTMSSERSELEAMLLANQIGFFEQESLGRPLSEWPFYRDTKC